MVTDLLTDEGLFDQEDREEISGYIAGGEEEPEANPDRTSNEAPEEVIKDIFGEERVTKVKTDGFEFFKHMVELENPDGRYLNSEKTGRLLNELGLVVVTDGNGLGNSVRYYLQDVEEVIE